MLQALRQAQVAPERMAVVMQEVDARRTKIEWQAEQPMNPASLFKLLTTSAALDLLGPAYTWKTQVWLDGPVHDGVLEGSLVLRGGGDPTLVEERIWLLLRRVRQLGVEEVRGDIVLDRSLFSPAEGSPADFDGEPLKPYNVRPDALLLNYGSVVYTFVPQASAGIARVAVDPPLAGVTVDGSVPLSDAPCADWRGQLKASFGPVVHFAGRYPAACGERAWPVASAEPREYASRLLQAMWRESGGVLRGTVREGLSPTKPPSFVFASPPLADVVREINKYSNNVMAQQVFLTLGAERGGIGRLAAGREVLQQWLVDRLPPEAVAGGVIDNGAGLSRDQRVSAKLLSELLQWAWRSPVMSELMSSLPRGGEDGTLQRVQAPAGCAQLKTGSLRDVAGVAGYVRARSGKRYVLVGLVNDPRADAARPALEALVQWACRQ